MEFLKKLFPRSIAGRLTLWFVLLSLVPSAILVALQYGLARRGFEQFIQNNLVLLLRSRIGQVEDLSRERLRETELIAMAPVTVAAFKHFARQDAANTGAANVAEDERFRTAMENFRKTLDYPNISLVAPDGKLVFQLRPRFSPGENLMQGVYSQTSLADGLRRCLQQLPATISAPDYYPGSGADDPLFFSAQTLVEDGKNIGFVVIEQKPDDLYGIFDDYDGLGQTGEAKIARRFGDKFVVLNPLRDDPGGTLKNRRLDMGSNLASGVQRAVQKQEGVGEMTDWRGRRVLGAWGYAPSLDLGTVAKIDLDEAYAALDNLWKICIALLAGMLLIVVPLAFLVARTLSRPVGRAVEAAQKVAGGDLTSGVKQLLVEKQVDGEIGKLQRSLAGMVEDLRGLVAHIQSSIVSVMSTTTEMGAVTKQQEQMVQEQGSATMEVAAAVNEISATSQELSRTMRDVHGSAVHAAELATNGQDALTEMHTAMTTLAGSTSSISSRLSVISERANNINLAVSTITKVADQTNLLSINAAIEAEKAGEAGRGFLVVAREIRRLADQTAVATLEIDRIVKEMQQSVSAGVMEMDKFNEQVRRGVDEVGKIEEKLGEVIHAVKDLLPRFEQVNEAMSAQTQGADQIREAMAHLSEGAMRTSDSIQEFHKSTDQLRESIGSLRGDVSKFQI
jgi:methyl-accepting chemotaxis protein WspA